MFRIVLMAFLCFATNIFAQSVSGTVTDEDHYALPAVLVFNLRTEQKTYTDLTGKFTIDANESDELRFVRAGFERNFTIIRPMDLSGPFTISLTRTAQEIEEVQVSKIKLTGDLNVDSRNLTKADRTAAVEAAVGVPGPPEKPRETPADFKKNVLGALLSLSVQPQAIYDLISGDARRQKTAYRYEDLQDNISWIQAHTDEEYFAKMGIPADKITAFLQFSMAAQPELTAAIRKKNISRALFLLEETLPKFLNR
ncbi:carboxypeptidase-like regulatory domain-containing protein [Kaistella palustris]|uniref:carboxypeptidase-like regulatory domain-containing protein n=1 Tax=Kaistella palustris TaxID=493376 RepID=UPI000686AE0A|nr:carboxypeptidase-like regulatory domain-containing protein [Kaistella palustris]